jgi:hypothetical protein
VGLDVSHVRQREYRQGLGFLPYAVTTGHASLYLDLPVWSLFTVLRAGRYLAGDWGGTVEVGRRFDNGIEVGGFATFTNVHARDFGEGSFDKGIYVRIPFDLFGADSRSRAALNCARCSATAVSACRWTARSGCGARRPRPRSPARGGLVPALTAQRIRREGATAPPAARHRPSARSR